MGLAFRMALARRLLAIAALLSCVLPASAQPAPATPDAAPKIFNCDDPPGRPRAGGASVAQGSPESAQSKSWQPVGGLIEFTINSFQAIDPNASITTCFRWKVKDGSASQPTEQRPTRVDMSNGGKTLKVTVEVPDPGAERRSLFDPALERRVGLVPIAQVRIVALKDQAPLADVQTEIGVTHPMVSLLLAAAVLLVAFFVLDRIAKRRIDHPGILKASPLLRIISTPGGTASLSQFQILVWTFVTAGSTVYVASLSGQLVEITTGTLILLGISGATTLAAQAYVGGQAAKQTAVKPGADAAAPDAEVAAEKAKQAQQAAGNSRPPDDQTPRWSDLIVNDQNTAVREIDVSRVQMLLFTLISAVFVISKVITAYVIPEIPVGYLALMGISNGVYVGSKMVRA
jgi:hypothetical protein